VALAPDVIVGQTTPVIRALRQATSSIPIIMAAVNDPVDQGFVSSLAHPGGNITGFTFVDFQMVGKWLEMLKEAAPGVSRALLMFNPDTSPHYYVYLRSFEAAPRSIAVEVTAAPVGDTAKAEAAIAKLGREAGGGLIVAPDAFTIVHDQLLEAGAAAPSAGHLLLSNNRRARWLDVVWTRSRRQFPALGLLCRSHQRHSVWNGARM
jgi:putative tryptophan/tyrosine transport system substrate-binding protein